MNYKLDIDIKLEVLFDKKTGECKVLSSKPTIKSQSKIEMIIEANHTITHSELRYGILTLGAKNKVGASLPKSEPIRIIHAGQVLKTPALLLENTNISAKTHKSARGRVDGLTSVYALLGLPHGYKLKEDDTEFAFNVRLIYSISEKTLTISLIK